MNNTAIFNTSSSGALGLPNGGGSGSGKVNGSGGILLNNTNQPCFYNASNSKSRLIKG
jgi:hypothetical protein